MRLFLESKYTLDDRDSIYNDWKKAVNISAADLRKWRESGWHKHASEKPDEVVDRNLRLLETPRKDWSDRDYLDAIKTINFIGRHTAAGQSLGKEIRKDFVFSKRAIALINWAHLPDNAAMKKQFQAVISGDAVSEDVSEYIEERLITFTELKRGSRPFKVKFQGTNGDRALDKHSYEHLAEAAVHGFLLAGYHGDYNGTIHISQRFIDRPDWLLTENQNYYQIRITQKLESWDTSRSYSYQFRTPNREQGFTGSYDSLLELIETVFDEFFITRNPCVGSMTIFTGTDTLMILEFTNVQVEKNRERMSLPRYKGRQYTAHFYPNGDPDAHSFRGTRFDNLADAVRASFTFIGVEHKYSGNCRVEWCDERGLEHYFNTRVNELNRKPDTGDYTYEWIVDGQFHNSAIYSDLGAVFDDVVKRLQPAFQGRVVIYVGRAAWLSMTFDNTTNALSEDVDMLLNEETTQTFEINDRAYRVERLWNISSRYPVERVDVASFEAATHQDSWEDRNGNRISIQDVLADQGQRYPEHWERIVSDDLIRNEDLTFPILIAPTGVVVDGMHRIARAMIEGLQTIPAKRFRQWSEMKPALIHDSRDLSSKS